MHMTKINIAVLNYNGKELLRECLPSIVRASENSAYDAKVTVLENCSSDGRVDLLKKEFPGVNIYIAPQNKVYCSYNEFFKNSDDDIIIILNSDIRADKGFIDPLIEHFKKDPEVFFVSSKMYFFDKATYQGDRARPRERFGLVSADTKFRGHEELIEKQGYTFSTGNGAFNRKKFLELDGYDEIYLPGRYEDVDLCYRGWKSGLKGIYEPKSIIYHKGYASFKEEFTDAYIHMIVYRNSLLFTWKNITDISIMAKFYFWMLPRLFFFILTGRFYFLRGFWQALLKLPLVLKNKRKISRNFKLSDRQVLEKVR